MARLWGDPILYQWPRRVQFCRAACLSSIILSPLNSYVKMSPYETGDIRIEPERIATSGGDFIVREGGTGVCQSRLTAQPNSATCQTTQIPGTARRRGGSGTRQAPTTPP